MSSDTVTVPSTPLDRLAIAFSGICAVHCVLIFAAVTTIPLWGLSWLTAPHFHEWFLALALLPSSVALWGGYRLHGRTEVIAGGIVALGLMALAIALSEAGLASARSESVLTLSGAALLAATHWRNLRKRDDTRCAHH